MERSNKLFIAGVASAAEIIKERNRTISCLSKLYILATSVSSHLIWIMENSESNKLCIANLKRLSIKKIIVISISLILIALIIFNCLSGSIFFNF